MAWSRVLHSLTITRAPGVSSVISGSSCLPRRSSVHLPRGRGILSDARHESAVGTHLAWHPAGDLVSSTSFQTRQEPSLTCLQRRAPSSSPFGHAAAAGAKHGKRSNARMIKRTMCWFHVRIYLLVLHRKAWCRSVGRAACLVDRGKFQIPGKVSRFRPSPAFGLTWKVGASHRGRTNPLRHESI